MGRNSQFECAQKATQNPSDFTLENFFSLAARFCKAMTFQEPFLNPQTNIVLNAKFPIGIISSI